MIYVLMGLFILWHFPSSFPFLLIPLVVILYQTISLEDAVVTEKGIIPYRRYIHQPEAYGVKLKALKCLRYKNIYLGMSFGKFWFIDRYDIKL